MKFDICLFFENVLRKLSFHKIGHEESALHMKINIHFSEYVAQFFLDWKVFETISREIETGNLR
jgi:hypothetical protein